MADSSINTVEGIFWFLSVNYIAMGLAINVLEKFLPPFLRRILFYGKISGDGTKGDFMSFLLVPKSWFRHFYIFASIWCCLVVILTIQALCTTGSLPSWFIDFLNVICGDHRTVQTTSMETLLALFLMFIHIVVRCFETNFTQVFSKKATMNLIQYLTSYTYYFGVVVLLICRGQGFVAGSFLAQLTMQDFSWRLFICTTLFAFASYHQFSSHMILANLRRNKCGQVTSEGHFVPSGGYFELISSPHMFFECLIYLTIFGIIYRNSSYWAVLALVAANQFTMAHETHSWYKKSFPKYPSKRKALIPYIF